jgi:hypothetical protein
VDFYDDVLRELITAVGAALFVANLFALFKRGSDRRRAAQRTAPKKRSGGPGRRETGAVRDREALAQAPLARTVFYMLIGFIVMVAGIAAIATK